MDRVAALSEANEALRQLANAEKELTEIRREEVRAERCERGNRRVAWRAVRALRAAVDAKAADVARSIDMRADEYRDCEDGSAIGDAAQARAAVEKLAKWGAHAD